MQKSCGANTFQWARHNVNASCRDIMMQMSPCRDTMMQMSTWEDAYDANAPYKYAMMSMPLYGYVVM